MDALLADLKSKILTLDEADHLVWLRASFLQMAIEYVGYMQRLHGLAKEEVLRAEHIENAFALSFECFSDEAYEVVYDISRCYYDAKYIAKHSGELMPKTIH